MRRTAPNAFTLIELIVVMAIMAIVGVSAIANYANFGEDQKLKSAVLDIQSSLRTAQTNATTNLQCNTDFYATWQVEVAKVANSTTLNLKCFISPNPPNNQKTLQLAANIQLKATESESCSPPNLPYVISFAPISGKMNLGDDQCTDLRFVLQNTKTGALKYLIIEKGGRIYAQ